MKNNNNAHVNIPGITYGVALMPMKEVYEHMYDDVATALNALARAKSSKVIRNILQEIFQYPVDNRVSDKIQHMIHDIKDNVRAMHTNDYSRCSMCNDLEHLLIALNEAIEDEAFNEAVDEARHFFQFMVDHADKFVDWYKEMHMNQ